MAVHEINIYGDIVPFKWFNDGSEYDLKDLNDSLSGITTEADDELIVNIHTFGGCTATAFGIYNKLQRFRDQNKIKLTTRVDGWCASSGVIILLAGDRRIGNQFAEPFVHNAWTFTMGDKNQHQKHMEDLARVDDQIATLYANRTSIEKEKAIELMNSETFVTPEDSLAFGFYTELENVYAAENSLIFNSLRTRNNEQRNNLKNNMNTEKKTVWNKLKQDIDAFFGTPSQVKNKIVFTAENAELDFYELADDATPAIGDKAKYDGKPAGDSNEGTYVLQSGETYTFSGEELTAITPKEEEVDTTVEDLKTENATLTAEVENLKNQITNLKTEKETLSNRITTAETIIKNFNDFAKPEDDSDDSDKRDPKQPEANGGDSRVASAFNNLKKQK